VNTATDPNNCDTCGTTCDEAAGEICQTGGDPHPRCADVEWARWPIPDSTTTLHPPSYENNQDSTVTDTVTGLMWEQPVSPTSFTWAEAKAHCSALSDAALGGHRDWRLPTRIELGSLVDYAVADPGPTIDDTAFPSTPAERFWCETPNAQSLSMAWTVDFSSGQVYDETVASSYRVRCVR
jgi:hypothetical protein